MEEILNQNRQHRFNNLLSLLVIILSLYIFVLPFIPRLIFYLQKLTNAKLPYSTHFAAAKSTLIPTDNTLIIPKLHISAQINEGTTLAALNDGVWHRPGTSSPDKGSNTVIAGHRFTYSGKSIFYNLDQLKIGDEFAIFWQSKEYDYRIYAISEVPPTALNVEAPSNQAIATLYTCTPLWSAKNRLIVAAILEAK